MKNIAKCLFTMGILICVSSCTSYIVKPQYLPYDQDLNTRLEKRRDKILRGKNTQQDIETQLNEYEQYRQKSHLVITQNNKLALKQP